MRCALRFSCFTIAYLCMWIYYFDAMIPWLPIYEYAHFIHIWYMLAYAVRWPVVIVTFSSSSIKCHACTSAQCTQWAYTGGKRDWMNSCQSSAEYDDTPASGPYGCNPCRRVVNASAIEIAMRCRSALICPQLADSGQTSRHCLCVKIQLTKTSHVFSLNKFFLTRAMFASGRGYYSRLDTLFS